MSRSVLVALALAGCQLGCGASGPARVATAAGEPTPAEAGVSAAEPSAKTVAEEEGCGGSALIARPADYDARGPWPVGARTVEFDGRAVEIWYPARPGSERGLDRVRYDLRAHLPDAEAAKVGDDVNPLQACDCYRDLPLDTGHGPYPLVLFLHGAGSFRTQSAVLATHWASRGMIVVAPDLPAISLRSALGDVDAADPLAHSESVLGEARAQHGAFSFLEGRVARDRVAIVGHSFGGGIAARLRDGDGVRAVVSMASGGVPAGTRTVTGTIIGGTRDGVVPYARQRAGFERSAAPARLIGIEDAAHLSFSDICAIGRDAGGMLEIAIRAGVRVPFLVRGLARDGCRDEDLPFEQAWRVLRFATAAALEEQLCCDARASAALRAIQSRYPSVSEYRENMPAEAASQGR